MNMTVESKSYSAPPVCEREIYRYAACKEPDDGVKALLKDCLSEALEQCSYHVCFARLPVHISADCCDFEAFSVTSASLSRVLDGCSQVIVFAATVGSAFDRLIARYSRVSPSKALMLQAIGTERIEALCNAFCDDVVGKYATPRYSPGYGDLPLETQRDIVRVLDCQRRIGLCLNDSLLMSPSKSVTAFVGISDTPRSCTAHACERCQNQQCAFRGDL